MCRRAAHPRARVPRALASENDRPARVTRSPPGDSALSMKKIRVGVLTGGASAERDISLAAGAQIQRSLPADKFEVVLLDPLAFMVNNPALTEHQRAQAQALLRGGGRIESDRPLPKGLEAEIESASKALVPAT